MVQPEMQRECSSVRYCGEKLNRCELRLVDLIRFEVHVNEKEMRNSTIVHGYLFKTRLAFDLFSHS